MMKQQIMAVAAAVTVAGLAACSSSSSSPAATATHSAPSATSTTKTGTETITGIDTGSAAAANFNSNSNASLSFPEGVWSGLVATTVMPFKLPGNGNSNAAATVTFVTPAGNLTVHHSANQAPGSSNPNQPPPAVWTHTGKLCFFMTTFSKGTGSWLSGTDKFTGARGTLVYSVTAQGYAPLKSGQTKCGFNTTGSVQDTGAKIVFVATGPLTVKE